MYSSKRTTHSLTLGAVVRFRCVAVSRCLSVLSFKAIFWEWRYGIAGTCDNVSPHLAVRDGAWKYLENADGTRPELYKLNLYKYVSLADISID